MRMSCGVGKGTERLENELFLQPLRPFTYVTTHSPTLLVLYIRHSSFSNPSVASPTSQFILQPFFRFSYVTSSDHSPTFPLLHLRHNSFSNPSVALPTSQLILQAFRCLTYVTVHSSTLLSLLLRHKLFLIHLASRPWKVTQYVTYKGKGNPVTGHENLRGCGCNGSHIVHSHGTRKR